MKGCQIKFRLPLFKLFSEKILGKITILFDEEENYKPDLSENPLSTTIQAPFPWEGNGVHDPFSHTLKLLTKFQFFKEVQNIDKEKINITMLIIIVINTNYFILKVINSRDVNS